MDKDTATKVTSNPFLLLSTPSHYHFTAANRNFSSYSTMTEYTKVYSLMVLDTTTL